MFRMCRRSRNFEKQIALSILLSTVAPPPLRVEGRKFNGDL